MAKNTESYPAHPLVDQSAGISINQCIAWLAPGERIHSVMLTSLVSGADMDRGDVVALIRAAGGGVRVDEKVAFAGHMLAVWVASALMQGQTDGPLPEHPGGGYWLFFETTSSTPPSLEACDGAAIDPVELMRKVLYAAVGDDAKDWEDADGIRLGAVLTAALVGDLETAARELAAYKAVVAEADALLVSDG